MGEHMITSCQYLQYDIYMRLDFIQKFSLNKNDFTIVVWVCSLWIGDVVNIHYKIDSKLFID